ncbi:Na(+)/H(+) antiporter subunit B [Rosistilla carotiformis]|uniref:Na(+)/H(+) antiporter subunit B n=1 Tax=Rosistilla carotiformis TaxID=2528017 RepID=A0A518JUN2_9BACT|nr:Na+/H+ antiporter subunit B [Rosistilla carotiformis]QDV69247.1 Na(+)/H(+) antiporter subunit B [Rosistilla carotiformis]
MDSVILKTAIRFLMPLILLSSVFLFLRGHNEPGGGFVGGLMASGAIALYAITHSAAAARQVVRVPHRILIGSGLLMSLCSGLLPLLLGRPFLTGMWTTITTTGFGKIHLGTPLLFDLGVFCVVTGVTLVFVFSLLEE